MKNSRLDLSRLTTWQQRELDKGIILFSLDILGLDEKANLEEIERKYSKLENTEKTRMSYEVIVGNWKEVESMLFEIQCDKLNDTYDEVGRAFHEKVDEETLKEISNLNRKLECWTKENAELLGFGRESTFQHIFETLEEINGDRNVYVDINRKALAVGYSRKKVVMPFKDELLAGIVKLMDQVDLDKLPHEYGYNLSRILGIISDYKGFGVGKDV